MDFSQLEVQKAKQYYVLSYSTTTFKNHQALIYSKYFRIFM
jgi:hypothetical protein